MSAPAEPELSIAALDQGRATGLGVRVQPGARRAALLGTWNGNLRVAVNAPPERGRANESVCEFLAELFEVRPSAVTLLAGARARLKRVRIELPPARVRARLAQLWPA
ncbi:MAG: DUF167 domain-containing protein [Planctomycetota bacterium]